MYFSFKCPFHVKTAGIITNYTHLAVAFLYVR
jgi:hypothetical protein